MSSLPDISNLNGSLSTLNISKSSPGKLRYRQDANSHSSQIHIKANHRFKSTQSIEEEEYGDKYKDLEFRINSHLQKLQDYKYSLTSESMTKQRLQDKKLEKVEKKLNDRIQALDSKIDKVNKTMDIQHEYAEIKRQGEKLKTLELKFVGFQREIKVKEALPTENERILREKLDLMETKILEAKGGDQKQIEFAWTSQELKQAEIQQKIVAYQDSVDEMRVEMDKS